MLYKTALLPRIKKIIVAINFEQHRLDSPGFHRRRRNFPRFVESKHGDDVGALFNGVSNLMTRDLYQMSLMRHRQTSAAHDSRLFVIHRHNAAVAQRQQFFRQPWVTTELFGHQIQFNAVKPRRLNLPLTVFQYLIHVDHPAVRGDLALLPQT